MRNAALSLGCLCMVACGGSSLRDDDPGKAQGAAELSRGGEEVKRAAPELRPARAEDLALSVDGDSPVGPVGEERAERYTISVEIRNRSDAALQMGKTLADVAVMQGAQSVEGCRATQVLEVPTVLAPNGTTVAQATLPCALAVGEYSVVVTVAPNSERDTIAPRDPARAASMSLVVDDTLSPVGATYLRRAETGTAASSTGTLPAPAPGDIAPVDAGTR